ncbi:hypothetical protein BP5796_01120 [Coleophoma crateriformis]|uniref:Zn(2)-C6 fungal-type domain-containing protein n=1 Tax=Coleophoma crateriformis TaxID=565419 RepID=A0A3D8TA16_9HELO|nr:hypothetical protein BP5796_01120 [Coleophoma crateriformis]
MSTNIPIPPSGSSTPAPKVSRPRPTLTCSECRHKKLKCDRAKPCDQCRKRGRVQFCSYAHSTTRHRVPNGQGARAKRATATVKASGMQSLAATPKTGRNGSSSRDTVLSGSQPRFVEIVDTSSRYRGPSDRIGMLVHFDEARKFLLNTHSDAEMTVLMRELQSFHKSYGHRHKMGSRGQQETSSIFEQMKTSLPTREVCDASVSNYLRDRETILRIIHVPSFLQRCMEFWAAEEYQSTFSNRNFVCQLLAIVIISYPADQSNEQQTSQISRNHLLQSYSLIQNWLDSLHGKQSFDLATLQTRALLLLAQQSLLMPATDIWREVGVLLRLGMIAGLHQALPGSKEYPMFQHQQRLRLWATILELDLQYSLICAMPPTAKLFRPASLPLSVDDVDLFDNMVDIRNEKTLGQYSDALPQIWLVSTLKARNEAVYILCNNEECRLAQDLISAGENIEAEIQRIPSMLKPMAQTVDSGGPRGHIFSRIMLDMYLRRPLLAIQRQFVLSRLGDSFPEARLAALKTAVTILSYLDALDPEYADPKQITSKHHWDLFHVLFKTEITQAMLILCSEIQSFSAADNNRCALPHCLPDYPVSLSKGNLIRTVESVLGGFMKRIGNIGCDLKDVLMLTIVLQLVRSSGNDSKAKQDSMMKGAQRVLNSCRESFSGENSFQAEIETSSETGLPSNMSASALNHDYDNIQDIDVVSHLSLHIKSANNPKLLNTDVFDLNNIDFMGWDIGQPWVS